MSVNVVRGTSTKPVAVDALAKVFVEATHLEGDLIVGYPNLGGDVGDAVPEALWLSPEYGAVLFDVVEGLSSVTTSVGRTISIACIIPG